MKSKHPELAELARTALTAIRRWEESNETKKKSEEPDPDDRHLLGADHPAARSECDGLAGYNHSGHRDRAGADLDRALCAQ